MNKHYYLQPLKVLLLIVFLLILNTKLFAQNVGINSTGAAPVASAMLDIVAADKGLLIPRVALTATNAAGPIAAPATSLLVYNTATAGVAPNNVTPGYYYWNSAAWVRFLGASDAWLTLGNAGTNSVTNFIGTTDAVDWVIKTNNTEWMRVRSTGNIGIWTNTPGAPLTIAQDANLTFPNPGNTAKGAINLRITNSDNSTGITWSQWGGADNAQAGIYVKSGAVLGGSEMHLATTNNWATGPQTRVSIGNTGNVGIGTTTPIANAILDVTATNKGVVLPRMALTAINNNAPIGAWANNGLMVYNTATAGAWPTNVFPGFYYQENNQWNRVGGNQVVSAIRVTESTASLCINSVSPAWVVYPGTPITLALSVGQQVLVWAEGGIMVDNNCDGTADANLCVIDLRVSVNGADFNNGAWVRTSLDTYYGYVPFTAFSISGQYTCTVAGNYTFQVEARKQSGSANASSGGNNTSALQVTQIIQVIN